MGQTPVSEMVLPASHPACAHGTLQISPCDPFLSLSHYITSEASTHTIQLTKESCITTLPVHIGTRGSERGGVSRRKTVYD